MENQNQKTTNLNTALTKTNLQVRVVSNSEKENLSPDVFMSPPELLSHNNSPLFIQIDPRINERPNPFLASIAQNQGAGPARCFSFESFHSDSDANKKTDSVTTTDSLSSELSLISLNNQARGYKIPKEQEYRVFADITALHVKKRSMSEENDVDNGPVNEGVSNGELLNRRVTMPVESRRPVRNKENRGLGRVQPLLKYKKVGKKKGLFAMRRNQNRRSMRI